MLRGDVVTTERSCLDAKPAIGRAGATNKARYNHLAPLYDAVDFTEIAYKRRLRPALFAGLSGRILDAGIGTGCNIPFYPPRAWVVGVDLSPGMLARARRHTAGRAHPPPLAAMDLMQTGLPDACFDAVVCAFVLCTLDESMQTPALSELARICKPGGELRILDYALSRRPLVRLAMRAWQVWEKLVFHGAFDRNTAHYLDPAGFELIREASCVGDMVRLAVARRRD